LAICSCSFALLSSQTGCASGGQSGLTAPGVGQQAPPLTLGQRIGAAFKRTGEALTPKPRVIPAEDPLNLATQPKKVGPEIHVKWAQLFEQKGDTKTAIDHYQQALRVAPNDLKALVGLARLYDRAEQFDNATQAYERALRAHPNHAVVLNDLGLCYARQGDVARSLNALSKAVDADPGSKLYRNNLGTILIERGLPDEALRHFIVASGEPAANYNVGVLLYKKGDPAAAARYLRRAAQLDPSLESAHALLARLEPAAPANNIPASSIPANNYPANAAAYAADPAAQTTRAAPTHPAPSATSIAPVVTPPGAGGQSHSAPPSYPDVRMPQMGQYAPYGEAQTPPEPDTYGGSFQPTAFPRQLPPAP
jgi:Tfp pilus assembly protein PilF